MIYPTTHDLLRNIEVTLASKVEPSLTDLDSRSAMATLRHLLRHVIVRTDVERQILAEDLAALRTLLTDIQDYFHSLGSEHDGASWGDRVQASLSAGDVAPHGPSSLTDAAGTLRECLYQCQKHLQAMRSNLAIEADYQAIRASIRSYIVWQVEQENKLIAPAFYGRGPRR